MHAAQGIGQSLLVMAAVFVAIQVPFVLLTFFIALRERHRSRPYVPVDETLALPPNAYMQLTNAMIEQHGFRYLGVCRAGNERLYKMRCDVWLSPDRQVFAAVGAGKFAVIPHQATSLTSKLIDGRVLITVDAPGAMAADLSGMTEWKVVTNADFPELLARHRARLEAEMTPVEPYPDLDPLDTQLELIAQRAERMARAGYIYYLDDGRDEWRYTAWGAVVRVIDSYRRIFVQIMRNYGRRKLSRPGDYGYVPSQNGRTRAWLRYAEIGLWVTIVAVGRFWSPKPFATPRQAAIRALVVLGCFAGLIAIWGCRWWIGRATVDPQKRRRRRYAVAGAACLVIGGIYMMRPYQQPVDTVFACKVFAGGGRVYVVVEGARLQMRTSHLIRLLGKLGRPVIPMVVSHEPSVHILESDGVTARSTKVAAHAQLGEIAPIGQHLYMIDLLDDSAIQQWDDGEFVPAPPEAREQVEKFLNEDPADQCAAQGWECTVLAGKGVQRLSKTFPTGGRPVHVDVSLTPLSADRTRALRAKLEVPGTEPLVRTFPDTQ